MSDMESKMQERYDALPYLELEAEIERLERGRDIQKGNAERWEKLAIQYKREIERLEAECSRMAVDHACLEVENKKLEAELKQANAVVEAAKQVIKTGTSNGKLKKALAALETDDE